MADRSDTEARNAARPSTPIGNVLRRLKKIFAVSIVFSLAVNMMILVSPLYMMQIYNRVLPSRSESTLIMLTALIGLSIIKAALIIAYFMHMKFERLSLFLTLFPMLVLCILLLFITIPDASRILELSPR